MQDSSTASSIWVTVTAGKRRKWPGRHYRTEDQVRSDQMVPQESLNLCAGSSKGLLGRFMFEKPQIGAGMEQPGTQ